MDDIDAEHEQILSLNYKVASNNQLIADAQKRLSDANARMNSDEDRARLNTATDDFNKLTAEKTDLDREIETLVEENGYDEVVTELIKDTGIKTNIIKQYIPHINKLVAEYLNIMDLFVAFELDEKFNETIKSRHFDHFSYNSFSEGEKDRINIALLFTWRKIAEMKNSVDTNILIMDETFDASLDTAGLESLLAILDTLPSKTFINVITHKRELLEDKFDRSVEYRKNGHFTYVVETKH